MLVKLQKRDEHSDNFKEKNQRVQEPKGQELKWKYILEGINNTLHDTEELIRELEDSNVNHSSWGTTTKKDFNSETSLWDLWDNIKHTNIHIMGVPKEEEKEQG